MKTWADLTEEERRDMSQGWDGSFERCQWLAPGTVAMVTIPGGEPRCGATGRKRLLVAHDVAEALVLRLRDGR